MTTSSPPLLIVIPLFRNAGIVPDLVRSLCACRGEVDKSSATLLLINDSPDDAELASVLARELPSLREDYNVELRQNDRNLGFVHSANSGLQSAVERQCDALLMNSDIVLFPGAIRELREVAYLDPMIGFVNPRSNNATIASLPQQRAYAGRTPQAAFAIFNNLSRHLPRLRYVPTAVGFCLYIKVEILREFGLFDPIYGKGYNEENDLIMRANRCGYRAVLANKAFVYHIGEQSFALTETPTHARDIANRAILDQRYPEYTPILAQYFRSPEYCAELLLTGLLPGPDGRLKLALDGRSLGAYHSGTSEAATQLFRRIVEAWSDVFEVTLFCAQDAFEFHELDKIRGLRHCAFKDEGPFAAVLRFGQPFYKDTIAEFESRAPVVLLFMLDTIALDCAYLSLNTPDLQVIWQHALSHSDVICYNSAFTGRQFAARFDIPAHVAQLPLLHSLVPAEYEPSGAHGAPADQRHILLLGNHYDHKFIAPTIAKLLERTNETIAVLGYALEPSERIKSYQSGALEPEEIERLYAAATVIGYPSHYEGFGLPIMHALAHRKPIVARRLPAFEEIVAEMGGNPNIYLADSTDEIVDLIASGRLKWILTPARDDSDAIGWARSSRELRSALDRALERVDYARLVARLNMAAILDPFEDEDELEVPSDLDVRTDIATRHVRRVIRVILQIPGFTTLGQMIVRTGRLVRRVGRGQ
jgi:GT2 family glycosyltransferase